MSESLLDQIRAAAEGPVSVTNANGHDEITAKVLGLTTVYVIAADGTCLGREEIAPKARGTNFYQGGRLKGGRWIGSYLDWDQFLDLIKPAAA